MLKNKILEHLSGIFNEWLLGFNEDKDFKVSIFNTEKINLKNAIINAERINWDLKKKNIPFRIKAGMIGMLSVKVSFLNF